MAPRHGKTRLVAEALPKWVLGRWPDKSIVLASYSAARSGKSSKDVRRQVQSNPLYRQVFPGMRIRQDVNAGSYWETTEGGSFQATSIGGALTGFGADILIIDDYLRGRKEAESLTMRDACWDWYMSVALTRLSPNGIVIVIATRWHADDLIGRLTDPQRIAELTEAGFEDENFEEYKFEALAKHADELGRQTGEALWPEKFSERWLLSRKAAMSAYEWGSLYDQNPKPREGGLCDVSKIQYCNADQVPTDFEKPRCWDLAVTKGTSANWTAGARGGYHVESDTFYVTHMHRSKSRWLEVKQKIGMFGDMEKNRIYMEAQGLAIGLFDEVERERMGKNIVAYGVPKEDKVTRALPWFAHCDLGKVVFVRGDWNADVIDEILMFTGTGDETDDQIDAISLLWDKTHGTQTLFYD